MSHRPQVVLAKLHNQSPCIAHDPALIAGTAWITYWEPSQILVVHMLPLGAWRRSQHNQSPSIAYVLALIAGTALLVHGLATQTDVSRPHAPTGCLVPQPAQLVSLYSPRPRPHHTAWTTYWEPSQILVVPMLPLGAWCRSQHNQSPRIAYDLAVSGLYPAEVGSRRLLIRSEVALKCGAEGYRARLFSGSWQK